MSYFRRMYFLPDCCHARESGYPEVFDFKKYRIPDKDFGINE